MLGQFGGLFEGLPAQYDSYLDISAFLPRLSDPASLRARCLTWASKWTAQPGLYHVTATHPAYGV
jgi:hypothetical protein